MKPIVYVAVYPECKNYLNKFLYSLSNQTYKDFVLFIVNDGLEVTELEKMISKFNFKSVILNINESVPISKVREEGFKFVLKNKFNYIIFADADDFFAEERVEKSLYYLKNNDVVWNNVSIVDDCENLLEKTYFNIKDKSNNIFVKLGDKNYFGLSNTAIRSDLLNEIIPIPNDIIAVDWWMYSILTYHKYRIFFIEEALTFYRQHDLNTIGTNINENKILRGILVKKYNYYYLSKYFYRINDIFQFNKYQQKYFKMDYIENSILKDKISKKIYLNKCKVKSRSSKFWWEDIIEDI